MPIVCLLNSLVFGDTTKAGHPEVARPFCNSEGRIRPSSLGFPYPEHFSPTRWACSLGRGLAILHLDSFGILDFPFGPALDTVSLHEHLPPDLT